MNEQEKAQKTISKIEDFLKDQGIESFFVSAMTGGFHFVIAQGPIDRLLLRALEQMYSEDPNFATEVFTKLLDSIKAQCIGEGEMMKTGWSRYLENNK